MKADTIICTKGNLSKIIMWGNSKNNERSKREVINEIAELFKQRADIELTEREYSTAYYSPRRLGVGRRYTSRSYKLIIRNGAATLEDVYGGITYFLKERRAK